MSTIYKVLATDYVTVNGMDCEPVYCIHFTFRKGYNGSQYEPPEQAGFDFHDIKNESGSDLDPHANMEDWAQNWLDENTAECYEIMESGRPDY
jgi:hypothetical protein